MAKSFKLSMTLRRAADAESVHYKMDGGRFDTEKTLKLNINTKYNIKITFKPVQKLDKLLIMGTKVDHAIELSKTDDCNHFVAEWLTNGVTCDKAGNRQKASIIFEFTDDSSLTIPFQCKFYKEQEVSHCRWGTPISCIDYDCRLADLSSQVAIIKEFYR